MSDTVLAAVGIFLVGLVPLVLRLITTAVRNQADRVAAVNRVMIERLAVEEQRRAYMESVTQMVENYRSAYYGDQPKRKRKMKWVDGELLEIVDEEN